MYFTKISLKNFGPFADAEFHFKPHAINWIVGNNGSGKTQMAGAMLAAIVGSPALSLTAGGIGPSSVALVMEDGAISETVCLHIAASLHGKSEVSKTAEPLALQALAAMSGTENQRLMIGHMRQTDFGSLDFREVENLLPDAIKDHPLWADVRLKSNHASYAGSSIAHSAAELIGQFAARRRARFKLPLIVDEVLWRWSSDEREFFIPVLDEIARDSQVFLLCPGGDDVRAGAGSVTQLSVARREATSLAAFNSWYDTRKPNLRSVRQAKWVHGTQYPAQENRSCEFKEVKGNNPLGAIKGVVDQYAVAFMNAGTAQEGAIFWGIRDSDRSIVGVQLRPQDCDELRRIVTERLHQIVPPIAPSTYRIDLHPVSNGSTPINDLFVVEIRVPSVRRTLLFATGGQEVYIKTDAGKRKLSPIELQQELIQRLGIDPVL
ncbi:AAA family ATPase [Duganella sp. FT109W]|uniref:AAA family ATPase n=1 Tax=Duganella margarita TaxID=2692170 RepID=A0ABW9WQY5_9BURK|nr:ATP-binding protein [Duganella margarita]MYN42760.1 AAA family ATPase [Duganella margarita]